MSALGSREHPSPNYSSFSDVRSQPEYTGKTALSETMQSYKPIIKALPSNERFMRSCVTFNMNTLIYTCVVFPLLTTQQFAMYVRILWLEQENLINNVLFFSFSRMEKVARVSSIMLQKLGTLCCWIFCCNTAPSTFIPERTVDSQPSC